MNKLKKSIINVAEEKEKAKFHLDHEINHPLRFKKRSISNIVKHDHKTNRKGFKK